jgi:hypothetical protein
MSIVDKIFSDHYYQPKRWEKDGKIYEYMGVKYFKKLLFYFARNKRKDAFYRNYFLKEHSLQGLASFEKKTRKSERSHVIIAFWMLLFTIFLLLDIRSVWDQLVIIMFVITNIFTNIYPIFLQRYNRFRIQKVLNKYGYSSENK